MNALVWTGPGVIEMKAQPLPAMGPGEALIEVAAAGICGSEISGFLGLNKLRVPPLIMGHEAAGRLVRVPDGRLADGFAARKGARVTFNPLVTCGECDLCRGGRANLCRKRQLVGVHRPGGFAEFVAVPVAQIYLLPDTVSDVTGSLAEPLACSIRTIALARAGEGDGVLIVGAGIIGLGCLLAAREAGAGDIIVADRDSRRLATAKRWGASRTVDAAREDLAVVLKDAAPGGVQVAVDAVGSAGTRTQCVQAVVPGGRAVFIGLHEEESPLPVNYLIRQEVSVTGSFAYSQTDFGAAMRMLERGVMKPDDSWLEERPLAAGAGAFKELADGTCDKVKIVLRTT